MYMKEPSTVCVTYWVAALGAVQATKKGRSKVVADTVSATYYRPVHHMDRLGTGNGKKYCL